jgi:hypothetical protein
LRIANCKLQIVLAVLVWMIASVAKAQQDEENPRPPVVGRPELFDEDESPIGAFQTPTVQVAPSGVQVEDPLTLTIRIAAAGKVQRAPGRFRLDDLPGFREQFFIEYPTGPTFRKLDERSWELVSTLKPRSTNVQAVPSFPFVFFTPGFLPPQRGYQIQRTPSVPITVRPRRTVQQRDVRGADNAAAVPESVFQLAEGSAVRRASAAWSLTALLWVGVVGLLLPPFAAVSWCILWRRRHPDSWRRVQQRRSHAAWRALAALRTPARNEDVVLRTMRIMASYLAERFDLAAEEPTPAEAGRCLDAAGCSVESATRAVAFFQICDAARFAQQAAPEPVDLAAAAEKLILDLEAESCRVPASC